MLKIQLFGQTHTWIDDREIKINRRKSRALVYYLAASQHPVKRQLLIELFWLDLPRKKAQQTLRTTLHGLRKSLGEYLETDNASVHLTRNIQVDVRSFEEIMNRADIEPSLLKDGLDLFQGDFLQDFYLPDSTAFEDWVTIQREVYRRLAKRGFHSLSKFYESQQNYSAALNAIDRALLIEPLQEDLQREAIRLVFLAGDRPGAIRRYDQLRKLLDEEMGVPPMAETRALYDSILLDKLPHPSQVPGPSGGRSDFASPQRIGQKSFHHRFETLPFIGRQKELQMLGNMTLQGNLLLIEGGPGLGKTRLAEEFAKIHPGLILAGAARELEQGLPYQPFIEAFRRLTHMAQWSQWSKELQAAIPAIWLSEAGRLAPDFNFPLPASIPLAVTGNAGAPPTGESRLWEGIFQLLQGLATLIPIILFIDDLHWADKSTLGLLGYLLRQFSDRVSGPPRINFIATARSEAENLPYTAFLQMIQRDDMLDRLVLNRLSAEEVGQLSNAITRDPIPSFSEWLMKNSEGIPFILVELVRYAQQNKIIVEPPPESRKSGFLVDQSALSSAPVVPQTVYNLIKSRLDRLSEPSWRILSAAVAAGRVFDFAVVARASAMSDSAALDAIDELLSAHILEPLEDGRFRFYHPLTMEVVYREVGDLRHRIQHRRIAEAMESIYSQSQLDRMAGVLAFHYAETNDPQRAAPYAILAGDQANRLSAWDEAAHFYRQALKGMSGVKRVPVLMALGGTAFQTGEISQAIDAFHESLLLAQDEKDQAAIDLARLDLAQVYLINARFDDSISLAKQVRSEGLPANTIKAEVSWGTALSLQGEDLEEAEKHLLAAVAMCDRTSKENCEDLATIKFELGSIAAQQGNLKKAISLYKESLEIANEFDSENNLMRRILANNNIAYHMLLDGDERAEGYAQAGLKLSQEKGMLGQQPFLYSTLGEIALQAGKLDAAKEYFTQGLKLAQQLGMKERITGLTANLGRLAFSQGQASLAIHRFSTALARAENLGLYHLAAQIRIWLVPLLPPAEARVQLKQARIFAERGKRKYLLEQIKNLEN
jgi:DNA-binding SARP family transcriptional activator/Tfp pilus assembly protein PilF